MTNGRIFVRQRINSEGGMNAPLIWKRYFVDRLSTAAIARMTKERECDVDLVISQGINAQHAGEPMPWVRVS